MKSPARTICLTALCVTTLLTLEGVLHAQAASQRSTANPYAGLRGAPSRGLASFGASSRGISNRATARPMPPVIDLDEKKNGLTTSSPAPTAATPPVAAAPRPAAKPAAGRPRAPLSKIRPRLITLKTGEILRGRASLNDGEWRLQTRDGWQTFPADAVRRSSLESELLAEIRKRRRHMDRTDADVRLNEARWMLDLGLTTEALVELDELLGRVDAEEGALALLSRVEPDRFVPRAEETVDDMRAMEQLLSFATRSSPSIQELAIQELVPFGARHRNELERLLQEHLIAPDPARQAFGDRALRRLFPGRPVMR